MFKRINEQQAREKLSISGAVLLDIRDADSENAGHLQDAIHLTNDYHTAHLQEDKYHYAERTFVMKQKCTRCGEPIIPLSPSTVEKIYGKEGDVKGLSKMCPQCRRKVLWEGGVIKK